MSKGGMAIAPWLPLGGLASSLGGLTSPLLTLGGLISLMTDLRGFTSMVIRLGSSTSIATIALHRITPPVLRTSQFTHNIHSTIAPSNTLDSLRMFHFTKLGWVH